MKLDDNFNQESFTQWIEDFLPDFVHEPRKVDVPAGFNNVEAINTLGESGLGVRVYIIETNIDPSRKKVTFATESFHLLRQYGTPNAIVAYFSPNASLWRLSLLTSTPVWSEGKIITKLSNPKRQSYVLGSKAKVKTPHQYLITKGKVIDFADLKSRFSMEIVNKEFYKEISKAFIQLVGGTLTIGKSKKTFESLLKLPYLQDRSQTHLEFAVRLIGRVIFTWFLREKHSPSGHTLMPRELLSHEATLKISDYYHNILEPIFFEILNKQIKTRKHTFSNELFSAIPYLNGGLFSPHEDDFYSYNEGKQAINHNIVICPDAWFQSLFEVLETYNFTIDENTSFDEELSIDPEMLGRIFENLLAEINPETGESARKSTGSYYTPRVIVDYMVDESLYLYLKDKTSIDDTKLRSLISYDLEDDISNPLSEEEKEKITSSLGTIKILDPACGSGAFPIGALQKIVFILQQIDPTGKLWFKRQLQNTSIELRRVIEREFQEKNFDYLRKLGIIRENIYGIDIQPIATEISRLRCFLTLVVDERVDDSLENRGVEPLPNLDFKFVTANTLVGLPATEHKSSQLGLYEDDEGIKELKEVREMFFNASGFERDQLKLQFVQTQNRMFQKLINDGLRGHADMTAKLTTWNPFSHESASWFDPEWMFGLKEGFDIVIANPPYGANIDNLIIYFKTIYLEVIKNYADIFKIFFSFGLIHLRPKGILTFITPNTYLTQPRYKDLRKYLLKYDIKQILNLGLEVFEGAVVPTCISIVQNSNPTSKYIVYNASKNSKYIGNLENLEITPVSISSIKELPDYCLLQNGSPNDKELPLDKIMIIKDAGIQYHRSGIGLKNKGGNDLFERLVNSDNNHFKNTTPIFYGKKLIPYHIDEYTDEYFNLDYKHILRSNESVSFSREAFDQDEKILWRQTAPYIMAAYDNSRRWFRNTLQCGWINDEYKDKANIKYILALLNSKYLRYIYQNIVNESSGRAFPQVKLTHVKKLPIRLVESNQQKPFIEVVEEITRILNNNNQDVSALVSKLDEMVYSLYELNADEIMAIENEI